MTGRGVRVCVCVCVCVRVRVCVCVRRRGADVVATGVRDGDVRLPPSDLGWARVVARRRRLTVRNPARRRFVDSSFYLPNDTAVCTFARILF